MEYGAVLGNDSKETPEKRILSQPARMSEVLMGIASLHPSLQLAGHQRHSGAMRSIEPGIHFTIVCGPMASGLALRAPGMTTNDQPAACAGRSRWRFMTILFSAPR